MEHALIPVIPLKPESRFGVWGTFVLRSAGFPFDQLKGRGDEALASHTEAIVDAREAVEARREDAVEALRNAATDDDQLRKKLLRQLLKRTQPPTVVDGPARDERQALHDAQSALNSANATFDASWANASEQAHQHVAAIARSAVRMHAALAWQNPDLGERLRRRLTETPSESWNKSLRRDARTLDAYVTRYCAKNDSVGFYGPFAWCDLVDDGFVSRFKPGHKLLATARPFLETWATNRLARAVISDERRLDCAPRFASFVRLADDVLHFPFGATVPLDTAQARVARCVDGVTPARAICSAMEKSPHKMERADVIDALNGLVTLGALSWNASVPPIPHGAEHLFSLVDDDDARLHPLREALTQLSESPTDATVVARSVNAARDVVTALTDVDPNRGAGQNYAGRMPITLECHRDVSFTLGRDFLTPAADALELYLRSVHWVLCQTAAGFVRGLDDVLDSMGVAEGESRPFFDVQGQLVGAGIMTMDEAMLPEYVRKAAARFGDVWQAALSHPDGTRRVEFTSDDIRARVVDAFPLADTPWGAAVHISPDVLISASDPDALAAGDYEIVLGEVHPMHTLGATGFLLQHENLPALEKRVANDIAETTASLLSLPGPLGISRFLYADGEYVVHVDGSPWPWKLPPERVLPASSLVVERHATGAFVVEPERGLKLRALDVLGVELGSMLSMSARLAVTPKSAHTPRITIDKLIVARETWRIDVQELMGRVDTFGDAALSLTSLMHTHGMPRHVFVGSPAELKPFYVDFCAPLSVAHLEKLVRDTRKKHGADARVTFSEMVPDPDHLWLTDADGHHYTSELRLICVDQKPARDRAAGVKP